MRGDGVLLVAVRIVPILALAEVERPGEAVFADFPALSGAGNDVAERIVLHERVDGVRADNEFVRRAALKVVHRCDFAGIQRAVHLLIRKFTTIGAGGRRHLSGGGSFFGGRGLFCLCCIGRFRRSIRGLATAGEHTRDHHDRQQQGKKFLHVVFSPLKSFC